MKKGILISIMAAAFLISGCSQQGKKEESKESVKTEKNIVQKAAQNVQETASNMAQKAKEGVTTAAKATKESASNMVESAKESAKEAKESVEEGAKKAAQKTQEVASNVANKAKEAASNVVEKTKEKMAEAKEAVSKAVSGEKEAKTSVNGEQVFAKCAGCHGAKAEKKALGKSQVIAGWPADKIQKALEGYKSGTYGGVMKSIMQGQVKNLSDAEIKAVAEYISKL